MEKNKTSNDPIDIPIGSVIQAGEALKDVEQEILALGAEMSSARLQAKENHETTKELAERASHLTKVMGQDVNNSEEVFLQQAGQALTMVRADEDLADLDLLQKEVDSCCAILLAQSTNHVFPKLSTPEVIFSSAAGLLSVAIDVFLVGTPEIVKLREGSERFDGSKLTALIRQIGNDDGPMSQFFKWLSDNCKVPYDIPAKTEVLYPNNHRLRSLAHDPFFGLFFAIFDILMGTTTCIDNNGVPRILINPKDYPVQEKYLAVLYYVGHLFSDLCTMRGLPIPGFFLTQFVTYKEPKNNTSRSLAEMAEDMYRDGYDLRHFASMSTSVLVKDLLLRAYLHLTTPPGDGLLPIAMQERATLDLTLKKEKMLFIANSVATTGNLIKFAAPPNCCNPCALNLPQWTAFIKSGVNMFRAAMRDCSVAKMMDNRKEICVAWETLLRASEQQ